MDSNFCIAIIKLNVLRITFLTPIRSDIHILDPPCKDHGLFSCLLSSTQTVSLTEMLLWGTESRVDTSMPTKIYKTLFSLNQYLSRLTSKYAFLTSSSYHYKISINDSLHRMALEPYPMWTKVNIYIYILCI